MKILRTPFLLLAGLLLLCFPLLAQDYEILRVENVRNEWNKLKLGNNPSSFWDPQIDVTIGGNTLLEIEFRVSEGSPDMSRVQIRPNGYSGNPVSFANYLPQDFAYGFDWYTISIPLADFDSLIDFTSVYLLQIPYSNMAGTFVMEFRSIEFTGGSTPYVWFGEGKRDNIHDGQGFPGQMTAAVEKEFYYDIHVDLPGRRTYYNDGLINVGTRSDVCQSALIACMQDDTSRPISFVSDPVSGCKLVPGTYQVNTTLKSGAIHTQDYTVSSSPSMAVSTDIVPPTASTAGSATLSVQGGAATYFTKESSTYKAFNDTIEVYNWETDFNVLDNNNLDVQVDLFGNTYVLYDEFLQKRDENGNLLWTLTLSNTGKKAHYTDPLGNTYITGNAGVNMTAGTRHLGNNNATGFVARVNASGDVDWLRACSEVNPEAATGDARGSVYFLYHTPGATLVRYGVNGHKYWSMSGGSGPFGGLTSDNEGNIYAGFLAGPTFAGTPVPAGEGASVIKTSASGVIEWIRRIPYSSDIRGLAATDLGLIYVVNVNYVFINGGSMLTYSHLSAIDKLGNNIFNKELNNLPYFYTVTDVATGPSGFVYTTENPGVVRKFDPLGVEMYTVAGPEYYYAFTPYISLDGTGRIFLFGIDSQGSSLYLKSLSPASYRTLTIPSGASSFYYEVEDAKGQTFSETINFTTTSITGINATLDNNAYEISWEPALGEFTGYEIYRQDSEQLTRIGSVAPSETSFTHYTEVALKDKPEYVVRVLTNTSENQSNPHSPAVLTAKAETGGKVDLNWQPYTGYENATYTIYRGADEHSMEPIASLKSDQFTFKDKLPASGEYLYRLEIKGEEGTSRSNTVAASSEISDQEVALWPNPAIDVVHCRWEGRSRNNTLELTDLQGRLVAEMHNVDPSGYELKRGNTPAGIYLLTFEDAAGKTTERLVFR
ncbi:T9SS type A sorting domain-containing protein [Roseivirga sp. BDSF3-8]|uniref:T9SS type A sorting domain-containing protein n=1 Tax=Roseivirga sp. BDSF3-8 TaxID=3241598 RepID=UPI003531893E